MTKFMRNENHRQSFPWGWFVATIMMMAGLALTGCSNGSSSHDNMNGVEGAFIDSPVQGLNYTTPSGMGLTDETGRFVCNSGEMVQFMIGDVMLGEAQAKDVVTPMDFVDSNDLSMGFNNPMLVNMGRFLQSLDADGNPENGITITQEVRDQVSGRMIDFHQSIYDFENDPDVMAMFATMNGLNMPHNGMAWELTESEDARQHMIDHMGEYMTDSMKLIMNEQMGSGMQSGGDVDNDMMGGATSNNMMGGQGENNLDTPILDGGTNNNMMSGNSGTNDGMMAKTSGTFVDSPVQGLTYTTSSGSGVTDENGQFFCNSGEMVQFMIGDTMMGEIQAKGVITPMDFVDPAERTMGFNHPMLVNMGRFLQSLDADANPENGITITEDIRNAMLGLMIDFHQSIQDFETDPDVMAMLVTLNSLNMPHNGMVWELVDVEDARQHMIDHMSQFMDADMLALMNEHMGQGISGADVTGVPIPIEDMGTHMNGQTDIGTHMNGQTDMGTHGWTDGRMGGRTGM